MDKEYMDEAYKVAENSKCLRDKVGAVIVKDGKIISKGYNAVVGGVRDCPEIGCIRDLLNIPSGTRREVCRGICAEQHAISNASRNGVNISDSTIYITASPCHLCSKLIVNSGIKEIVYDKEYKDMLAEDFLMESGIKTRKI